MTMRKIIEVKRDGRRWTVDRYVMRFGEREYDNRYLIRKVTLCILGVPIWCWFEDVRVIPVHEWARYAFGELGFPDEYPAAELEGRRPA